MRQLTYLSILLVLLAGLSTAIPTTCQKCDNDTEQNCDGTADIRCNASQAFCFTRMVRAENVDTFTKVGALNLKNRMKLAFRGVRESRTVSVYSVGCLESFLT